MYVNTFSLAYFFIFLSICILEMIVIIIKCQIHNSNPYTNILKNIQTSNTFFSFFFFYTISSFNIALVKKQTN